MGKTFKREQRAPLRQRSNPRMTEYHKTNGHHPFEETNGHSETHSGQTQPHSDLEESVISLLSQSQHLSSSVDLSITLTNDYKRAAKAFINKKFDQSYSVLSKITPDSIRLYGSEQIDTKLFVNIWSLYFNLIDIFVNKDVKLIGNSELEDITTLFLDPDYLFDQLFQSDKIAPPKLVLLLLLIKLNNSQTDLVKLRSKLDIYLVNASSHITDEEYEDFKELLEVYHIHLMAKLGGYEEAEYLIRSNPHLKDKQEELVTKLRQRKIDLEEEEKAKKELQKKRKEQALLAQQRKEQKIKEQRILKEKRKKEKEEAALSKLNSTVANIPKSKQSDDLTILNILKNRILRLKNHKISIIALVLTIISLLTVSKTFSLLQANRRIKESILSIWSKFTQTLQMAFKVTYV